MKLSIHMSSAEIMTQAILWLLLFGMPVVAVMSIGGSFHDGIKAVTGNASNYVMWIGCFYLNYFFYIPRFYLTKQRLLYFILLIATYIMMGRVNGLVYFMMHGTAWAGTGNRGVDIVITCAQIILNTMLCFAALAFRVIQRNKDLVKQLDEGQKESSSDDSVQKVAEPIVLQAKQEESFMFVKCESRQVRIKFEDILYISAMKDYIRIYLISSPRPITALSTMKSIEEKLPKTCFCRVHRSYIVRMDKIESIERNRIKIGNELIPVSDSYQEEFHHRLG